MGASCQDIPLVPKAHNVFFRKLSYFPFRRIFKKTQKRLHRKVARRGVIYQLIGKIIATSPRVEVSKSLHKIWMVFINLALL